MKQQDNSPQSTRRQAYVRCFAKARIYWSVAFLLVFGVLAIYAAGTVSAAPSAQTVPPPRTATPTKVPVATRTPVRSGNSRNDDNNNNSSQQNRPTPTAAAGSVNNPNLGSTLSGLIINANRLNVREGPSTTFPILGVVQGGSTVQLFERNDNGTWLRICCVSGTTTEGWVSSEFVQISAADNATLAASPTPTSTAITTATTTTNTVATPAVTGTVTATTTTTATTAALATVTQSMTSTLLVTVTMEPPFARQGDEVTLIYTVTNPGAVAATNVELRNELPAELHLAAMSADASNGVTSFVVNWPTLAAGATTTVAITVTIAADLADGFVFDNLAVIAADGIEPYTGGITIGMPPDSLPSFQ